MEARCRFLLLLCFFVGVALGQDCVWNKDNDFPSSYPPLLIDKDAWISLKAVDEGGQRIVRVAEGTSIVVACSGTTISSLSQEVAEGVCVGGGFLEIDGSQYTIEDLACASRIKDATLPGLGPCGDGDIGEISLIGFDVVGYPFYGVVEICFEHKNQISLYAKNIVYGQNVEASDGNPDRPSFKDEDYYYPTLDANDCYLTANQNDYFTELLGDPNYIDLDHSVYFSRGHLAPNADFFTEMEADATFYYIDAVPQWQPYNGGNWMYLEGDTRDLAALHLTDLEVYTGPWVNLVLDDVNNNPTTIYLCGSQSQDIIPIPQYMWKVVYEPSTDRGVALITSNNPHEEVAPTPFCPNIGCDMVKWLEFDPTDLTKGYTYCCTVQDLKDANPHAPYLPTATLLLD